MKLRSALLGCDFSLAIQMCEVRLNITWIKHVSGGPSRLEGRLNSDIELFWPWKCGSLVPQLGVILSIQCISKPMGSTLLLEASATSVRGGFLVNWGARA